MKHKLESKLPGEISISLRYADDTTLMAESEEELKSLLMKVKEESKNAGLKHNIQKTKIMAPGTITSLANRWGKSRNSNRFYSLGLQNHCDGDCSHEIKRPLAPLKKSYDKHRQHIKEKIIC